MKQSSVKTRYWHSLDDKRVQCDLCPRYCHLKDGQRGLCFVRRAENHEVILDTWGRSSGFCVDPIEKKPLNHFYPGTPVLSFGTAGCNLACKYCQNWDISKSREMDRLMDQASPEQIADAAKQHGCESVAFTYNDPVIFAEYATDCAKAAHERQIWLKGMGIVPADYIAAECCRAPLFPVLSRDVAEIGLVCKHCSEACVQPEDLPVEMKSSLVQWAKQYEKVHAVAHWEEDGKRLPHDYEKQLEAAAIKAEKYLRENGDKLAQELLDYYPAVAWEDQDECLSVRPEDLCSY